MTNKTLFQTVAGKLSEADTVNHAGGKAFALIPKHTFAQYAVLRIVARKRFIRFVATLAN